MSTEWIVRFNKAKQVSSRNTVYCLENKYGDFEDDTLFDW